MTALLLFLILLFVFARTAFMLLLTVAAFAAFCAISLAFPFAGIVIFLAYAVFSPRHNETNHPIA